MLSKLKTRLRALLRKSEMERDLDEELRYHVEQQAEQNIRLGMNPDEARYAARKAFGGVEQAKERSRDARGVRWLENFWQDIRFGARMLLNKPGFTLIAVITLALGVGANSVIFSFFNGILLRPLPFQQPERLVLLDEIATHRGGASLGVSWPNYLDWRAQNQVFSDLGCYQEITFTLTGVGDAEELSGAFISDRFFELLGVAPQLGRAFTPEENQPGRNRVAILSYGLWRRRFSSDQKILGKTITLVNRAWVVVGVMPPGFKFPGAADFWTPLAHGQGWPRSMRGLGAVARLKPGVTREQAQSEMSLIARRLSEQYAASNEGLDVSVTVLRDHLVKDYRRGLWILLGAVGSVLLIACANVANLLLARATARQREMAVRAALGAGRFRIVRQMLCESLLLGALGGVAGMSLAWLGLDLLLAALPAELPFWMKFNVDGRVLSFTLAVSLLTSLIFGAAPAWQTARIDLIEALKDGGRSVAGGSRDRLRRLLVVAQVALALILLAGAGLMMRSFLRLRKVNLGFNPDNVVTLRVTVPGVGYRGGSAPFFQQLVERVNALPGVEAAGAIVNLPLASDYWQTPLTIEGQPELALGQATSVQDQVITPHYFRALGVPLVAGRAFTDADTRDAPKVTIIDERLASELWPNESPLGKRIRLGLPQQNRPWQTIVGVVGSVRHNQWDVASPGKLLYIPSLQYPVGYLSLVVRSPAPPKSMIGAVRNVVKEMDPNLPITHIATMQEVIAESIWQPRLYAILFAVFAVVSLTLAAVGIYGVMSYTVTARTHEIGIRMALGAERRHTLKLVVGQGMVLALGGVGIGVAGALLLTRLMRTLLFGVSATDPLTFAGVSLLLFGVALLACYLPARKAAQVDPLVALRRD